MKNSDLKRKYEANMKNIITKTVSSVTNQIIAIETKKLKMSTLARRKIVGERYLYLDLASY